MGTRVEWEALMRKSAMPAVVGQAGSAPGSDRISASDALAALAGLGQATRLEIFRLLMRSEPDGLAAGVIADKLGCPHNTLSTHIGILARSGLVFGLRAGRSVIYRANAETMKALIAYLANDCCEGHPELCDLQDALRESNCGCPQPARDKKALREER
jgi:ArsR family transcriptional regulator